MRPVRSRRPTLGATLAILALTACGADDDPIANPATSPPRTAPKAATADRLRYDPALVRTELDAARARWSERGWPSYRFSYTPVDIHPPGEVHVDVMNTRAVRGKGRGQALSVEGWFDEIDAAIGTAVDIRVTYDDAGYPRALSIDVDEMVTDQEFGFELAGAVHVADPIAKFIPMAWDCFFGFWVANPDQTVAFMVSFADVPGIHEPRPGSYALADLSAGIVFGTELMNNWCVCEIDDEAFGVLDHEWPVTGGKLELTVLGNQKATATLTDVVARTPDGEDYPLGDVTITNSHWGLFPG